MDGALEMSMVKRGVNEKSARPAVHVTNAICFDLSVKNILDQKSQATFVSAVRMCLMLGVKSLDSP